MDNITATRYEVMVVLREQKLTDCGWVDSPGEVWALKSHVADKKWLTRAAQCLSEKIAMSAERIRK